MNVSRAQLRLALLRLFAKLSLPLYLNRAPAFPTAPRILLIRPDHLGDLLFATPALRVLKKAFPKAYLACMVGPWGKAVLENNPNLDELIVCEFPGFSRTPKVSALAPYRTLHKWALRLQARHFDLAIILRFDHWWGALLAYLAGIPRRLGYAIPECEPFLTSAVPYRSQQHEVQQNLALIEQAIREGGRFVPQDPLTLEFPITNEDRNYVASYLAKRGVTAGRDLVAIHPGAGAAVKQWRAEAFAEVAEAIMCRWNAAIVITGSSDELDLAWSIYAQMCGDPIIAAGDTSLGQLAALFQRCRLVIGSDCGPLHLAVAVGTPTIHLYGPTDPRKFGPWGASEKHFVLTSHRECIPCNRLDYSASQLSSHPCVREITVQAVLEAVQKLMRV